MQGLPAEAERVHRSRIEGLEQDVHARCELYETAPLLALREIDDRTALAQCYGGPVERGLDVVGAIAFERWYASRRRSLWQLDLEHFCTEVCQHAPSQLGSRCAQIQHTYPGEGVRTVPGN